jgi:hypothetical protein
MYSSEEKKWKLDTKGIERIIDMGHQFLKLGKSTGIYARGIEVFKELSRDGQWIVAAYCEKPKYEIRYVTTKEGSVTKVTGIENIKLKKKESLPVASLKLAGTISVIALYIINKKVGELTETGYNIAKYSLVVVNTAQKNEYAKTAEAFAKCVGLSLYMGVLVAGGVELTAASYTIRAGLSVYSAYKEFGNKNEDRTLEGITKLITAYFHCGDANAACEKAYDAYCPPEVPAAIAAAA